MRWRVWEKPACCDSGFKDWGALPYEAASAPSRGLGCPASLAACPDPRVRGSMASAGASGVLWTVGRSASLPTCKGKVAAGSETAGGVNRSPADVNVSPGRVTWSAPLSGLSLFTVGVTSRGDTCTTRMENEEKGHAVRLSKGLATLIRSAVQLPKEAFRSLPSRASC
jgi:hypothetical protein